MKARQGHKGWITENSLSLSLLSLSRASVCICLQTRIIPGSLLGLQFASYRPWDFSASLIMGANSVGGWVGGWMDGCRNISYRFCFSGESLLVSSLCPLLFPRWYPGVWSEGCVWWYRKSQVFWEWDPISFSCQILSQLHGQLIFLSFPRTRAPSCPNWIHLKFHGPHTPSLRQGLHPVCRPDGPSQPLQLSHWTLPGKLPKQAHWNSIHCPSHVETWRSGNKLQASFGLTVPTFVMLQMYPGWVRANWEEIPSQSPKPGVRTRTCFCLLPSLIKHISPYQGPDPRTSGQSGQSLNCLLLSP